MKVTLVLLAAVLGSATAFGTGGDTPSIPLAVVVNRANPADSVSIGELRKMLLLETLTWPNGKRLTLAIRERGQRDRAALVPQICGMSDADLVRFYLRAAFRGDELHGPKELTSAEGVRKFVFNVPGAIGFLRADEVDATVKVLRVDLQLPGEPDYKVKVAP